MRLLEDTNYDGQKRRSPNFPLQGLGQAVDNLKKVYEKDRTSATTREVVAIHLGYEGINGTSKRIIASTMQYGLLEEAGQGKVKVSLVGEGILHPKDAAEKKSLLNEALLKPKVFSELTKQFGPRLPSDATLESLLIREYKFAPAAARTCIKSLRQSYSFLESLENFSDAHDEDEFESLLVEKPDDVHSDQPSHNTVRNRVSEQIEAALSTSVRAEVHIIGQMRQEDLEKFKNWLDKVVKPWADFVVVDQD